MLNEFSKKEAPIQGLAGMGGGAFSRLLTSSGVVLGNRSLRFNDGDSAYLGRTPSSTGNRRTWTWSAWIKRSELAASNSYNALWSTGTDNNNYSTLYIDNNDQLFLQEYTSSTDFQFKTENFLRDTAAWYHIVVAFDSTQSTDTNRMKIYINNVQADSSGTRVNPSLNYDSMFNLQNGHSIGRNHAYNNFFFSGYITDIHFIDGSALTPSSFGSADSNGVWQRSTYSGSYGTNGYHVLDFANDGTIGNDTGGQGNNYTANNFSTTAGSGNDVLFDFPTNDTENTDSGAGGEVIGNYACINPLLKPDTQTVTLSNGNLDFSSGAASGQYATRFSSIGVTSGKWYAEFTVGAVSNGIFFGVSRDPNGDSNYIGGHSTSFGYSANGSKYTNNSASGYGDSFTANDVIGVALDLDSGTLTFYKNGSSQGTAYNSMGTGTFFIGISGTGSATAVCNFGQRPFEYAAPANHKCLTTTSLPTPGITDGSDYFNTALWTGDGGSSVSVTTGTFEPDFIWIKQRNKTYYHQIYDAVRDYGSGKALASNENVVEGYGSPAQYGYVSATSSTGFTGTAGSGTPLYVNENNTTYVAWAWDAGSSTVSNTDGSITTQVRASQTAGFSIATYSYNNSLGSQTLGHGLGAIPDLVIRKDRNLGEDWSVYSKSIGFTQRGHLNLTSAFSGTTTFGSASATSTVNRANNMNNGNYVDYSFVSIPGYSAIGTYEGNGNADGPFVHCGFKPAWIMLKNADTGGTYYDWRIIDTARHTYNAGGNEDIPPTLFANLTDAEKDWDNVDILSNGFKIKDSSVSLNESGATQVFIAFAENPFQANGGLAR